MDWQMAALMLTIVYVPSVFALALLLGVTVLMVRAATQSGGGAAPRRAVALAALCAWSAPIVVYSYLGDTRWLQSLSYSIWSVAGIEALALWIVSRPPAPEPPPDPPAPPPYPMINGKFTTATRTYRLHGRKSK